MEQQGKLKNTIVTENFEKYGFTIDLSRAFFTAQVYKDDKEVVYVTNYFKKGKITLTALSENRILIKSTGSDGNKFIINPGLKMSYIIDSNDITPTVIYLNNQDADVIAKGKTYITLDRGSLGGRLNILAYDEVRVSIHKLSNTSIYLYDKSKVAIKRGFYADVNIIAYDEVEVQGIAFNRETIEDNIPGTDLQLFDNATLVRKDDLRNF